ncbi:MAG: hypothetical protein U0T84_06740 [Chitinophagales bacterium]
MMNIYNIGRSAFAVVLWLMSWHTQAATTATFRPDSNHVEIGDWLKLHLVVRTAPGTSVQFPPFAGDTLGRLDIVSKSNIDTATANGQWVLTQQLEVAAYDSGIFQVPPVTIYAVAQQQADSVTTEAFEILTSTLPVDTAKPFRPIKAPLEVPYTWHEFLPWMIGVAIWIAALLIGLWFYDRYKKKKAEAPKRQKPKEPAHIWALRELRQLESTRLWQEDSKQYHSKLTDILRLYLEYRFDYYAMEATTEEIGRKLNALNIGIDPQSQLMEVLRLADFVKFAKLNPAPDEHLRSMQRAIAFVEQTKQLEETNIQK